MLTVLQTWRGARRALRRGGLPELARAAQRRLRPRSHQAAPPKPAAVAPPPPPARAQDVEADAARAFFERRRASYDRLATAVAPYVDSDAVVFDIGANIGYFTEVLAEVTGFHGRAELFEPVPHLAELCRETLSKLPFETHLHEFGLSDDDATIDIYTATDGNLGWNTLVGDFLPPGHRMERIPIQVRRFETCGVEVEPTFVKIDVEGAEYLVLRGMLPAMRRWSSLPPMLCEIGWGPRHPHWDEELAVFDELAALGYRTFDLDGNPVEVRDLVSTTDVVFLPSA